MKNSKEMNVNYIDTDDMASVTVFQAKHINQIKKLMEAHPDEIKIVAGENVKNNNGMMVVHLPKKYCKVSFGEERSKREMTDEQRAAASKRMKKAQETRMERLEVKRQKEEGWL